MSREDEKFSCQETKLKVYKILVLLHVRVPTTWRKLSTTDMIAP